VRTCTPPRAFWSLSSIVKTLFRVSFLNLVNAISDGWNVYDVRKEFTRQGALSRCADQSVLLRSVSPAHVSAVQWRLANLGRQHEIYILVDLSSPNRHPIVFHRRSVWRLGVFASALICHIFRTNGTAVCKHLEDMKAMKKFRSKTRVPALCYFHQPSGAG